MTWERKVASDDWPDHLQCICTIHLMRGTKYPMRYVHVLCMTCTCVTTKPLRLLWILVCFIACDSSFFLLCSLLSFIVVHYACDCSCTCTCTCREAVQTSPHYMYVQ